jgi:hypothetical protein
MAPSQFKARRWRERLLRRAPNDAIQYRNYLK